MTTHNKSQMFELGIFIIEMPITVEVAQHRNQ